jgi:phosphoribosylanthranilate isomerase
VAAKVKICGLMRPDDAAAAVSAGAAYLGVVFAESARAVTGAQARAVVSAAAGIPVLGVFASHSVDEILHMRDLAGLSGAQLHGVYSGRAAAQLRSAGLVVWRVVRIATPSDLASVSSVVSDSDAVLVEPRVSHALGGAGVALDLDLAIEARRRLEGHPMVLAGGLTPEVVGRAVRLVGPEIVDVSSGVEARPGVKTPEKMMRFVEAVFAHSPIA